MALLLLLAGLPLQFAMDKQLSMEETAEELRSGLQRLENDFYMLIDNQELMERLAYKKQFQADLDYMLERPFSFLIYRDAEVLFWNNSDVAPEYQKISAYPDGVSYIELKKGVFQLVKQPMFIEGKMGEVHLVALQPIKYDHNFNSRYLKNNVNPTLSVPEGIELKFERTATDAIPFSDPTGDNTMYLSMPANVDTVGKVDPFGLCLQVIGLLILMLLLYVFASSLIATRGVTIACLTFFLGIGGIAFLIYVVGIPVNIERYPVFDYKSDVAMGSLGYFFIGVFLVFTCIFFFVRKATVKLTLLPKNIPPVVVYFILLSGVFLLSLGALWLLELLVVDYGLEFSSGQFFSLNTTLLLGMLTLGGILSSYFALFVKSATVAEQLQVPIRERFVALAFLLLPYVSYLVVVEHMEIHHMLLIGWMCFYVIQANLFSTSGVNELTNREMLSWGVLMALFATFSIFSFYLRKEKMDREQFVQRIVVAEDPLTETAFKEKASLLMAGDPIVRKYYANPFLPMREMVERVKKHYLVGHFEKYKISVKPFRADGSPMMSGSLETLEDIDVKISLKTVRSLHHYLHLITNPNTGSYNYLAKIPIFDGGYTLHGYMIIEMEPISDQPDNIYPELVIQDKFREPERFNQYSYAIYKDSELESHKGPLIYGYRIDEALVEDTNSLNSMQYVYVQKENTSHLVYKPARTKTVIVSRSGRNFLEVVSLFSYVFSFLLLGMLFWWLLGGVMKVLRNEIRIREIFSNSLRSRINFLVITMLFISFLVIGGVTVWYFNSRSARDYQDRLLQKQKEVLASVSYEIRRGSLLRDAKDDVKVNTSREMSSMENFKTAVEQLSNIHGIDINVYDYRGQLMASSFNEIFDEGVRSSMMDPQAFFEMHNQKLNQYLQKEKIGSLSYLSAYMPIDDVSGRLIGYINLPSYDQEKELRAVISAFVVTLSNIYILLLIGGGFLTLIIANNITDPLKMIGDKLQNLKLGQKNELLFWPNNDEIGVLVDKYNNAIQELDQSAEKLAESERQYAWQQMARQVAHEIKNPLTPMKLSIQHLQRAYQMNSDNKDQMAMRVSKTLIEQIDTLSRIASEFSNFAKMPEPKNELMEVKQVLNNVINLYEDAESVRFFKLMAEEDCMVYADRHQLNRVFNNLIKNAIQAIPEEREGVIVVNVKRNQSGVLISVADNGTGIDEEKRDKVFAPNFTTKSSGMGLGLAMSRNIIEMANGKIWFDTIVGEGTTFYIRLPLHVEVENQSLSLERA